LFTRKYQVIFFNIFLTLDEDAPPPWKNATLDTRDVNRHATVLKQNGFLLYNSFQWLSETKVAPQQTNQSVLEPKQQRDPCDVQENTSYDCFWFKARDWLKRVAHQPTQDRTQYMPRNRVWFSRFSIFNRTSFSPLLALCSNRNP